PLRSFYGSADHRILRSFPTRRSSDLQPLHDDERSPAQQEVVHRGPRRGSQGRAETAPRRGESRSIPLSNRRNSAGSGGAAADRRDRKSTRLNSSHLGISYAVFCLKKK